MLQNYKMIKPTKNGDYLCLMKGKYYKLLAWANNLYFVDDYAFEQCKNKPGWYAYDSEVGYYECNDVLAWTTLPEIPEEFR